VAQEIVGLVLQQRGVAEQMARAFERGA